MSKTRWHSKVIYLVVAVALVLSFSLAAVPALAAPLVASVTETAFGADTTNHNVTMPATVNAGDLLIVIFTNDGNAGVTTPAGWTVLASSGGAAAVRLSVYYKIAAGTEGGTKVNFVTASNEQAAAQVYRITEWDGTTPPEISPAATGNSTAPDPASLNPVGWDVGETLWLAVAGQDRGDQAGTTAYPANYTNGLSTQSSMPPPVGEICRLHSARRVLAAASENPGAFTIPVAEQWVAFTIAVRPIQYDLAISSTAGGNVTAPGEGVFTYDKGTVVNLTAVADESHRFVEWTGNVSTVADVGAEATTITMNGTYSITAEFEAAGYYLAVSSTVGGLVTEPGEGVFTHGEGTVVYLVAAPDLGYQFDRWTGDVNSIANIESDATTITVNGDYSITAKFVAVGVVAVGAAWCFIATAAYGSPMAEEIQILREFRDEYLLTNPVGTSLVDFYYRVSPPIAEFITEHPSLKPIVRPGLLPAVAMSTIAVNTPPAEKVIIVGLLVLVSVAVVVWAARRRGRGIEHT